jgi:hypothetical protein
MAKPGPPLDPQISNVGPTSLTISWSPSVDDDGSGKVGYVVNQYLGAGTGVFQKSIDLAGTTLNITNLLSGKTYTFFVWAFNGVFSDQTGPFEETTLAASWIRHNGVWVSAVPYVRVSGTWKSANPYVRQANVWQPTL